MVEVKVGWFIVCALVAGLVIYIVYLRGKLRIAKANIAFLNGYIDDLEKERAKQSDQLRKKGIEVDELKKKIKRLERK